MPPRTAAQNRLVTRAQTIASSLTIGLAAVASAAGFFRPVLYRDPEVLAVQAYGQDLLTLAVAVPVLATTLVLARRGSRRAYVVWLGVTGYVFYTYLTYSLMTAFNELYLVYTTLLWLSLYTFVSGVVRLDADRLKADLRDHAVWPYILFHVLLALFVGVLWLSEIVPALLAGTTPPSAADAGLPVNVIQSLDLGVILPAFLLTAYWLRQRKPRGTPSPPSSSPRARPSASPSSRWSSRGPSAARPSRSHRSSSSAQSPSPHSDCSRDSSLRWVIEEPLDVDRDR